jgi:DNA-binding NarL/FixJ family response regulator
VSTGATEHDNPGVTPAALRVRRLVVIDDHQTFADLLRVALSDEDDLDCVGVAYDLDSGLELVGEHLPDLVVIDYQFEGDERDGVLGAGLIAERYPATQVVLLTGHADAQLMQRAAAVGVSSLMAKDGSLPDLLLALRTARHDGFAVHPQLLGTLISGPSSIPSRADLSSREHDVLVMLTMGLDARGIADRLGISLSTCRGHVKTLLRKLGAHTQLEAVAIARRQGLVDGEGEE